MEIAAASVQFTQGRDASLVEPSSVWALAFDNADAGRSGT